MKISKEKMNVLFQLQALVLLYSVISILAKMASQYKFNQLEFYYFYFFEWTLLMIYAVFWQKIIKKTTITFAYVNKGIAIVWILVWSAVLFGERIQTNNLIGAVIIIIGIGMVAKDEN